MKKSKKRSGTDSGYGSKAYSVQDQSAQHQPVMVMLPRQHDPGQYYDDYVREFDQPAPECSGTDSGFSSKVQAQSQLHNPDSGYSSQNYTAPAAAHQNLKLPIAFESSRDKLARYNSSDFGRHSPCSSDGETDFNNREIDILYDHVEVAIEKVVDSDDEGIEEDEMQNASICMGTGSNSQDVSSHLI